MTKETSKGRKLLQKTREFALYPTFCPVAEKVELTDDKRVRVTYRIPLRRRQAIVTISLNIIRPATEFPEYYAFLDSTSDRVVYIPKSMLDL